MLSIIHGNHLGIEKCKQRARDVLYWPGMNEQIENLVKRCETCQTFRSCQRKEPMKGHAIPDRPWQKVALDLFELQNENYFVLTDYFSKFFEVTKLSTTTSSSIIKHLKPHFARYGIPEELISDNGPQLRTRTLLPTSAKLLQPKYSTHNLKSSLEKIQAKQKHYYDHGTRTLEPLQSGEGVRLRDTSTGNWIPATVKRIADEPRSYIV